MTSHVTTSHVKYIIICTSPRDSSCRQWEHTSTQTHARTHTQLQEINLRKDSWDRTAHLVHGSRFLDRFSLSLAQTPPVLPPHTGIAFHPPLNTTDRGAPLVSGVEVWGTCDACCNLLMSARVLVECEQRPLGDADAGRYSRAFATTSSSRADSSSGQPSSKCVNLLLQPSSSSKLISKTYKQVCQPIAPTFLFL